ncbi:hypothetical protein RF11_04709 [Thelohanellus kitauei]|uniref:Uncharacterized protein n=1 Tax=Thelohanellus kitauei TaxID=669202 RepID=A0A0C2NH36_THEKT|nr:hypothetical protein RF11_04709 [Thelohanellus kitauei]
MSTIWLVIVSLFFIRNNCKIVIVEFKEFYVRVDFFAFINATYMRDNENEIDRYKFFTDTMSWDHPHVSKHRISITGHTTFGEYEGDFITIKITYNLLANMVLLIRKVVLDFESLSKRRIVGGLDLNELVKPPKYTFGGELNFFTETEHSSTDIDIQIEYLEATFFNSVIYC